MLCGGARGFHGQGGGSGSGSRCHLGFQRVAQILREGARLCNLIECRSKRLPSPRGVPFGYRSAGPRIIFSIDGAGIEPEACERLLQLANIVARNTGDEIPICRDLPRR
jgi:hypothetical protein